MAESANIWRLIMKPRELYTQLVQKPFCLTMASLDIVYAGNCPVQVMITFDKNKTKYLLCTLDKKNVWQVPLNLNIEKGLVTFSCNGVGYVHLIGYFKNSLIEEPKKTMVKVSTTQLSDESARTELMEYLKINNTIRVQRTENGNWIIQRSNVEKEQNIEKQNVEKNQKNKRKTNSKRNTSFSEDEATKCMKLSTSHANLSNNDDNYDGNIKNLVNDDDNDYGSYDNAFNNDCNDDSDNDDTSTSSCYNDNSELNKNGHNNDEIKRKENKKEESEGQKKTISQMQQNNDNVTEEEINKKHKDKKKRKQQERNVDKKIITGGVQVKELKYGRGTIRAEIENYVTVYYRAYVQLGPQLVPIEQFMGGIGFRFQLGSEPVVHGIDVGIIGMKVGGRRRFIIPWQMGFGSVGSLPDVPPYSTLVYYVKLKKIE